MVRPVRLCFDGSRGSSAAIARAGEIIGTRPAVVLYAWKPLLMGAFRPAPDFELTETLRKAAAEMDEAGERAAAATTRRGVHLAHEAGFEPVEGRTVPAPQSAWKTLVDAGRELDAEVVVLGARGRSQIRDALLGSVSSAVAHHAHCPVLVVRRGAGS